MLKSNVSMIQDAVVNPPWWKRQRNAVGVTYSDASLVQNYANVNKEPEFYTQQVATEPSPEQFIVGKFGLITSTMREQHVMSYENRQKVSQANWGSYFLAGNNR